MRLCRHPYVMAATSVLAVVVASAADARPEYLVKFQADPMRRVEQDGCGTCHVKPDGGGARNDFGTAFDGATRDFTPLLRASFPEYFTVATAKLPDGTTFYMSDPSSKVIVVERQQQKVVVNVADLAAPAAAALPTATNRMTFFVSSHGVEHGGRLGGLAGADRLCQQLAAKVGAADRPWRAYLSTSFKGRPAVNAGDRIGAGPWHNQAGVLVGRGAIELHQRGTLPAEILLTEAGGPVAASVPVVTGTLPSGMADIARTCSNWTANSGGEAAARQPGGAWNGGGTVSCAVSTAAEAPRLYCFSPE